jgi:hypothetical protein
MRSSRTLFACAGLALVAGCGSLGPQSDSGAPILVITSPQDGAAVGRQVLIEASAVDDIGVDKVRFFIDQSTTPLAEVLIPPFRATWLTTGLAEGSEHTIRVQALDAAKNQSSKEITVTIAAVQGAP